MYFHLYCKLRCFWRNLHRWQKFYTAAGSNGMDKFHLCQHPPSTTRNPKSTIHYPHHFEKTSSSLDWTGSVRRGGADQDIWPPCSLGEVLTKFKTQHLAENYHHTYHEFRGLGFAVVTVGLFLAFFYNVVVSE